jgi:outer membrane lipoprotein-sorting protein
MKKMKYLVAACIMSASLLVGCGDKDEKTTSSITPEELIENIENAENDVKSLEFEVGCDVNATSSESESPIAANGKINGKADIENNLYNLNFEASVEGTTINIECYLAIDDSNVKIYANYMGSWIKYEAGIDELAGLLSESIDLDDASSDAGIDELAGLLSGSIYLDDASSTASDSSLKDILGYLKDAKVEANDGNYVLSGKLDMDKIIAKAGDEVADYEDMMKSMNIDLSVKVNADYSLNKIEVKLNDFEAEQDGVTIKVNSASFYITADKYNEEMNISIPDEALEGMDAATLFSSMN